MQIDYSALGLTVENELENHSVVLLPPMDVFESVHLVQRLDLHATVTMLDPWYNKGIGGTIPSAEYDQFLVDLMAEAGEISDHVYLWGFPEIIARIVARIPTPLALNAWLTWYYKNNPSVIRGWRSSQMACLHLSCPRAAMYPEHFLNDAQLEKLRQGKLRYMPGPTSVLEEALMVGFIRRSEQTGHPSQKPTSLYDRLLRMVTRTGDLVFDPMCGSGTTGVAAKERGCRVILSDASEEYISMAERRLGVKRIEIPTLLRLSALD